MIGRPRRRENVRTGSHPSVSLDAAGVDELGIIPWPILLRRRLAQKVGIDHRWAVLWVVLSGLFTTSFTFTLLVVSLDRIAGELGSTTAVLTWAVTGPMLAFGVVGPAFGKSGDLWGHKRLFVGGLFVAGVFSIASALAWNAGSLILFRTLAATGGSACGPSAMAYINRMFDAGERVKPLSYWSFVTAGSPVIGVVLGGPLVDAVGWRVIFVVQAPMCFIGFLVALWLLPGTDRMQNIRFDVWGSVTLGLGAASLLAGISQGRSWGWGSSMTIAAFVTSIVLLVLFVQVERRTPAPLVVLAWFRTRNFALPVLSQACTNFAYMGGLFLVPQVLGSRGLGFSSTSIGNLMISRPLAFSLVAPVAALVTLRVGERIAGVAGAIGVIGSMLMLAGLVQGTGYPYIIAAVALSGVGLGISSPALTSLTAGSVHPDDLGVAGAMQQLMTQLGAVVGSAVMATISVTAEADSMGSFHLAFVVAAAVAALGCLCSAFVRSTPR